MVKYKRSPVRDCFGGAWSECFAERSGLFCFLPHPIQSGSEEIEGELQTSILRLVERWKQLVAKVFVDDDCAFEHE